MTLRILLVYLVLTTVDVFADPVKDLLSRSGYWKIAGADSFADGGSYCLSFLSQDGVALHLFILPDKARRKGELVFQLRRSYNDPTPVEVTRDSDVEEAVFWLLENYASREEILIESAFSLRLLNVMKNPKLPFPDLPQLKK